MRSLLILILCLHALSLHAQKKYTFESYVGWNGADQHLYTISSKDQKQHCLFLTSKDSLRAWLVDTNMQPTKSWAFKRRPEDKVLGAVMTGNLVSFFTQKSFEKGIHAYSYNTLTGHQYKKVLPFDPEKEKEAERVNSPGHFLYITASRRSAQMTVYDITSDSTYTTTRHTFNKEEWQGDANLYRRVMNADKMLAAGEPAITKVQNPNKLYVQGDTLYLLLDEPGQPTKAYLFDLANQRTAERNILHQVIRVPVETAVSVNSYLLGNNLFYVQATIDTLQVEISDIRSGAVLQQYQAGSRTKQIFFGNTPITQEGGAVLGANDSRELGKTKQLLRKMVNGKAVIMALHQHGRIIMTIASYATASYVHNHGSFGGTGSMMFMGGFSSNSWAVSAKFRSLLQDNTLTHIQGEPGGIVNDWADTYPDYQAFDVSAAAENLIMSGNKYYYACYDKKDNKLVIAAF